MQPRQLLSALFGSGLLTDQARSSQFDSSRWWLVPLTGNEKGKSQKENPGKWQNIFKILAYLLGSKVLPLISLS